jgi:hypothetical protein
MGENYVKMVDLLATGEYKCVVINDAGFGESLAQTVTVNGKFISKLFVC